jgi:dihydrofolate synthase/folylpolyglutamate synthase
MPERSLGAWLRHLEALHPKRIDLGLERVCGVARTLGLDRSEAPVLTIAGTNGKGSVAYASDALLTAHGLAAGRYTSPHLLRFNERISIGAVPAPDDEILAAFAVIDEARGDTSLSYFEFTTLAALLVFRERRVAAQVLEVGLGGRLDAVNCVAADVGVITAIDLDHQHFLGGDRESIGREKAGIGRRDRPVVLAEPAYPASVEDTLRAIDAKPLRAGRDWHWEASGERLRVHLAGGMALQVSLPAGLRAGNVAAALQAVDLLPGVSLEQERCAAAMETLVVPARRQRLEVEGRELVLDVAHNPAAMAELVAWLRRHPARGRCFAVLGLMADKDLPAMAETLARGVDGVCALALPAVDRAQSPERIWQVLDSLGAAIPQSDFAIDTVWQQLLRGTQPGERIVVCGSFHCVAGIMAHLELGVPAPDDPDPAR